MLKLIETLTLNAFISLGVILGGSLIGSLGAVFYGRPPGHIIVELAGKLKIWALVAAMGGTFDALKAIEAGFLGLQINTVIKQLLLILFSFAGAHTGYLLIIYLAGGKTK